MQQMLLLPDTKMNHCYRPDEHVKAARRMQLSVSKLVDCAPLSEMWYALQYGIPLDW